MTSKILWLNDRQVSGLLSPAEANAQIRAALTLHCKGDFQQPPKPYLRPGGQENEYTKGRVIAMPAYLGGDFNAAGIKIISGFPCNVERGLPRASGIFELIDTTTGFPLAIMECGTLSARRTGATAAITFETLAGQAPHHVGILGAGPIASEVITAMSANPCVQAFHVFDPQVARARDLAQKHVEAQVPVLLRSSIAECTEATSVLVLATTGAHGYLTPELAGHKALIIALSLNDATPELFLAADKVVADSFADSAREDKLLHRLVKAGRFSREQLYAELGQVIAGQKPGRERPDEFIYANLMGMGVEDLAVGVAVYNNALRSGVGTWLN